MRGRRKARGPANMVGEGLEREEGVGYYEKRTSSLQNKRAETPTSRRQGRQPSKEKFDVDGRRVNSWTMGEEKKAQFRLQTRAMSREDRTSAEDVKGSFSRGAA